MGVVYRGRHLGLDRIDAIKVIAPEFARGAQFRERFVRESRIAASVRHENVLTVYDAGEEGGLLYLTMQLVDGYDLAALIGREAPFAPERAAAILAPVADALEAAHEHGLVHRDVKPGNILIENRRGKQLIYLADFGLARETTSDTGLTSAGRWIGTADYVSPEQVMGERVDGRADVYSLGCVLYEMLCGRVPYPARSETAKLVAHVTKDPLPLAELQPGLPAAFDEVVRTAMARKPDERYASAASLCEALSTVATKAERGAAARERAERESEAAAKQAAEQERAEREAAARHLAARDAAEHERAEREAGAREQIERDQADHERAAPERVTRHAVEGKAAFTDQVPPDQPSLGHTEMAPPEPDGADQAVVGRKQTALNESGSPSPAHPKAKGAPEAVVAGSNVETMPAPSDRVRSQLARSLGGRRQRSMTLGVLGLVLLGAVAAIILSRSTSTPVNRAAVPMEIAAFIPPGKGGDCFGDPVKTAQYFGGNRATGAATCNIPTGPNPGSTFVLYFLYPSVSDARAWAAQAFAPGRCTSASLALLKRHAGGVAFCYWNAGHLILIWSYDQAAVAVQFSGSAVSPAALLDQIHKWLQDIV
jgi:hypothetical protein